ncbi:tyrosine-type recombinase/integrase [Salinicola halophilus]|uniref:tyrosine-type recombinase/integrase n=1 Tax=Salinicola halophilus TaxID=184065 RepID=UPI000DA124FE|nr:site-specific integrase [Salinicola halophilus]
MALTDTWLKAQLNREHDATFTKADRDGLAARVSPKGKITFQIRYRIDGTRHRLDLGSYPLTSLKEARQQALEVMRMVEAGFDPKVERAIQRKQRRGEVTVESVVREWYDGYCEQNKSNPGQIIRTFEIHVFPELGALPADKVSTDAWMTLLETVAKKYPAIAERILINIKQAYKWSARRGRVSTQPLQHIGARGDLNLKKRSSSHVIPDTDLALIWRATGMTRMMPKNRLFVRLCLLYGCRSGELRLSDIEHWDLKEGVWTVPPENHKTGKQTERPIVRPIFEPAREMLLEAKALSPNRKGALFTNRDSKERMGRSAVLPLPYNIMQWARRHEGVEMAHWSMHDLRRTMRTKISSIVPPHVAEVMLGHVMPGQQGVYDRYDYMAEQRDAYEAWWNCLKGIVSAD